MRHDARLDAPVEGSKATVRQHLEQAARQGSPSAMADLAGPSVPVRNEAGRVIGHEPIPFPETLGHLLAWLDELWGRSGADMGGLAPLSYPTIVAWARLTGRRPSWRDVLALLTLDAVRRHPEPEKREEESDG